MQPLSRVKLGISAGGGTPPHPLPGFLQVVAGCGLSPPHLYTLPLILLQLIVLEKGGGGDELHDKFIL